MLGFWNLIAEVFWSLRYFSSSWVYLDTPSSFSSSSTFKIFSCCCSLISLKAEVSYGWDMAWARQSSCVARRVEWGGGCWASLQNLLMFCRSPKNLSVVEGSAVFPLALNRTFFSPWITVKIHDLPIDTWCYSYWYYRQLFQHSFWCEPAKQVYIQINQEM